MSRVVRGSYLSLDDDAAARPDPGARLRVLVVAGSPPRTAGKGANGSTLIVGHLIDELSEHATVRVAYFDRPGDPVTFAEPGPQQVARLRRSRGVPVLLRTLSRRLWPTSAALYAGQARAEIRRLSGQVDVVLMHGAETFPFVRDVQAPVVVNEVDHLSAAWADMAAHQDVLGGLPARFRARRLAVVERLAAARASAYVVVNPGDAAELSRDLGREVLAIPNGVAAPASSGTQPEPATIAFGGTLDYLPNVGSLRVLVTRVVPLIRQQVPRVRLVVAGRDPSAQVRRLCSTGAELVENPADLSAVFAGTAVGVFPGGFGRGTRNTVLECLGVGTPVVASTPSARGIAAGEHLRVADEPAAFAAEVVGLLQDEQALARARRASRDYVAALPTWQDVASRYRSLLASVVVRA